MGDGMHELIIKKTCSLQKPTPPFTRAGLLCLTLQAISIPVFSRRDKRLPKEMRIGYNQPMETLLAIYGSPRRKGNTSLLLQKVAAITNPLIVSDCGRGFH